MDARQAKKLSGSRNWYRKRKRKDEEEDQLTNSMGSKSMNGRKKRKVEDRKEEEMKMKTRSVIFVDYSVDSQLVKNVREALTRLEGIVGCKVKAVERAGLPLSRQFPLTRLWDGIPCSREVL